MNRNAILFLAALAAGLSVVGVVAVRAQGKVTDPVLVSVSLFRSAATCTGDATYLVAPVDAQLMADLGPRYLPVSFKAPCGRLDAIDARLALPDSRSGKLAVQTQVVSLRLREDGSCTASMVRTLTPTDTDVAAVIGTRSVEQTIDRVPCAAMSQALVGALSVTGADRSWPVSVIALPIPLEP